MQHSPALCPQKRPQAPSGAMPILTPREVELVGALGPKTRRAALLHTACRRASHAAQVHAHANDQHGGNGRGGHWPDTGSIRGMSLSPLRRSRLVLWQSLRPRRPRPAKQLPPAARANSKREIDSLINLSFAWRPRPRKGSPHAGVGRRPPRPSLLTCRAPPVQCSA